MVTNRTLAPRKSAVGDHSAHRRGPRSALALLPRSLVQHDRRTDEAELLAQSALDEPLVRRVELAAREEDERRRRGRGLGAEQDLGLLAAAHRVRVLGDQPAEEGVQRTGGHAGLPALERLVER